MQEPRWGLEAIRCHATKVNLTELIRALAEWPEATRAANEVIERNSEGSMKYDKDAGDGIRKSLQCRFVCGRCDNDLSIAHHERPLDSHGAHEAGIRIVIHPCKVCGREVENMRSAVKTLLGDA